MKAGIKALILLVCAATFAELIPLAHADGCGSEEEVAAEAQLKKAESLERAGKLQEAFANASTVDTMCADGRRVDALRQRVGKALGGEEEKNGRLEKAFNWYSQARLDADADRVRLLQVKAKPEDPAVFSTVYEHFKYREAEATLKDLRAIAAKNADKMLAEEERAFAARKESFQELEIAGAWLRYLGDDQLKRIADRAEKRGDMLAENDGYSVLERALRYYGIADKPRKTRQVQDKALRLADGYAKTGETTTAVRFYSLAGAEDKAMDLEKRTEQAKQKKEGQRQEQFQKEQDDLEKELGF